MLQKLGAHIAERWERAAAGEHQATMADSEALRADYQKIAKSWAPTGPELPIRREPRTLLASARRASVDLDWAEFGITDVR